MFLFGFPIKQTKRWYHKKRHPFQFSIPYFHSFSRPFPFREAERDSRRGTLPGRVACERQFVLLKRCLLGQIQSASLRCGCGSKPMVPFWGRCTTHFRTYFSGDWNVHWGYGILTHGHMAPAFVVSFHGPMASISKIQPSFWYFDLGAAWDPTNSRFRSAFLCALQLQATHLCF